MKGQQRGRDTITPRRDTIFQYGLSYAFRVNSFMKSIFYQFQLIANCAAATTRKGYAL